MNILLFITIKPIYERFLILTAQIRLALTYEVCIILSGLDKGVELARGGEGLSRISKSCNHAIT